MKSLILFIFLFPLILHAQQMPSEGYITGPVPNFGTYMAGEDPSGNLQGIQIDSMGRLIVTGTTVDNASVGLTGNAVPGSATYAGAKDPSGNLAGLNVDSGGNLKVVGTFANPSVGTIGSTAPTSANLAGGIDGSGNLQGLSVNTSGQLNINNISGTISLPTGASTSSNQTSGSQKSQIVDGSGNVIAATSNALNVSVQNFPATQPISGTVAATQSGTWNVGLSAGSNIIGKISIDQTTPGTTNGVQINAALPIGSNVIGAVTQSGTWTVSTKTPINPNGSYSEITNLTTTAQTFTAPANAVGFIIESLSDNTANVRYKVGAAATTTSGMRLEPGRSETYAQLAANISVIAETGSSQVVDVQWILNQ